MTDARETMIIRAAEQIRRWFEQREPGEYFGHINRGTIWVAILNGSIVGFTEC